MRTLAVHLVEIALCSGVLLALYVALLERRVRFAWCRRYLVVTMALAAIIPLLRIPVWSGGVVWLDPLPEALPVAEALPAAAPSVRCEAVAWAVYGIGVAALVALAAIQLLRIGRLRRRATKTRTAHYTLVRTRSRIASFSFLGSVYVWRGTAEAELPAILAHEASHVRHRHSAERLAMELLRALLWWNPFVWIASRRLIEVQEFEADNDVLRSGFDRTEYMDTIFRQLFGYSPEIANGLRDSLTKKRFRMMTTSSSGSHALLRLAAVVPVIAGLVCAFSFTTRAAEVRFAQPSGAEIPAEYPAPDQPVDDSDTPFLTAEVMPLFEGGSLNDFRAWVQQRLRYPAEAMEAGVEGRVVVQFVVERDGTVSSIKAIAAPARVLADEAERVVALSSGRWTPGRQRGEAVRIGYTLPVGFSLAGGSTDEAQPIAVQGRVVDADGEPLAGALVVRHGSSAGTVTDSEGRFTIKVPEGTTLDVSHIGHVSVGVKAQADLRVVLLRGGATEVDEIVVAGFAAERK